MGSTLAGTVGAGIGSLIEGDDPREAFRSAALGGLSGAALAGLRGGKIGLTSDFSKSGTFLKGLTGAEDFETRYGSMFIAEETGAILKLFEVFNEV